MATATEARTEEVAETASFAHGRKKKAPLRNGKEAGEVVEYTGPDGTVYKKGGKCLLLRYLVGYGTLCPTAAFLSCSSLPPTLPAQPPPQEHKLHGLVDCAASPAAFRSSLCQVAAARSLVPEHTQVARHAGAPCAACCPLPSIRLPRVCDGGGGGGG